MQGLCNLAVRASALREALLAIVAADSPPAGFRLLVKVLHRLPKREAAIEESYLVGF